MKSIIVTLIFVFISFVSFSQNKSLSVGTKYGITTLLNSHTNQSGSLFSSEINYHFFKRKRVNLTTGIIFTRYKLSTTFNVPDFAADGTIIGTSEIQEVITNKYLGLEISSQIKLFNMNNKVVPYFEYGFLFQREIFRKKNTAGKPYNAIDFNLTLGAQFNNRVQFGVFYEFLLANPKSIPFATASTAFGIKLNYLFNLSSSK